jgi:hypothetical protein
VNPGSVLTGPGAIGAATASAALAVAGKTTASAAAMEAQVLRTFSLRWSGARRAEPNGSTAGGSSREARLDLRR